MGKWGKWDWLCGFKLLMELRPNGFLRGSGNVSVPTVYLQLCYEISLDLLHVYIYLTVLNNGAFLFILLE